MNLNKFLPNQPPTAKEIQRAESVNNLREILADPTLPDTTKVKSVYRMLYLLGKIEALDEEDPALDDIYTELEEVTKLYQTQPTDSTDQPTPTYEPPPPTIDFTATFTNPQTQARHRARRIETARSILINLCDPTIPNLAYILELYKLLVKLDCYPPDDPRAIEVDIELKRMIEYQPKPRRVVRVRPPSEQ